MFRLAFDPTPVIAVGVFAGRENTDDDFQRYVDSFMELDAIALRTAGSRGCYVIIVDPGNPPPSALWRRRIADASVDVRSNPLISVVTSSALIRGVATAINWLRPPPYEMCAHETLTQTAAWIRSRTSADVLAVLTRLEREARAGKAR